MKFKDSRHKQNPSEIFVKFLFSLQNLVHKICSSQVILNLAVAVKELVENSVDAGAKIVEIKIKNYGADSFEVVDNGIGISETNFSGITAKHHTSKLKDFSDLESIKTFGFRGEALSSLCALSSVSVTTRHSTSEHGTKLIFDHDGSIMKKSICARNVGTTVSIADFFITLPVRRGEFIKNYKKDFAKMVQLIQEYCLVLTGVKILCTNQPPNGVRQTVLSTNGSSVMENIISIFGVKQAKDLIKIQSPTEDGTEEGVYTQQSLADPENVNSVIDIVQPELDSLNMSRFKIEGFISNIEHRCARSSKDRQYFYINSRPVELRMISKIVNDVYHRYNLKQFPFVYLNLKMDQSSVDVNLSKDKRQVAVCNDTILQLAVKRSLLNTYGELPSKFKVVSVNNSVKQYEDVSDEDEDDKILLIEPGNKFGAALKKWRENPSDPTPKASSTTHKRKLSNELKGKPPKIQQYFHQTVKEAEPDIAQTIIDKNYSQVSDNGPDVTHKIDCKTRKSEHTLTFETIEKTDISQSAEMMNPSTDNLEENSLDGLEKKFMESSESLSEDEIKSQELIEINVDQVMSTPSSSQSLSQSSNEIEVVDVDRQKTNTSMYSSKLKVTLESIKSMAEAEEEAFEKQEEERKTRKLKLRFKESIDPSKNKKAEAELEMEIKKEMFEEMEILGQFNLGFIIAKLNSDLFIVDQHASDEKYNFEDLQKTTKLQSQPLVIPERLELTAIQEMTLIENLQVFEMNGFKFLIDDNAEAGKKIKIHSKPFSKNWEFGKEDIEEMIFMLDDSPNSICRPTRIRSMLASRACRKSVMIGDALTKKQMKKLIQHMGELDHPWVRNKQCFIVQRSHDFISRTVLMVDQLFDIYKTLTSLTKRMNKFYIPLINYPKFFLHKNKFKR